MSIVKLTLPNFWVIYLIRHTQYIPWLYFKILSKIISNRLNPKQNNKIIFYLFIKSDQWLKSTTKIKLILS